VVNVEVQRIQLQLFFNKTHKSLLVVCEEKSEVEFGMQFLLLCQLYLPVDETKHHIAIVYCQ